MEEKRVNSLMDMIKRFCIFLILIAIVNAACSKKEKAVRVDELDEEVEWKQMDAFHLILTEAYYPYKDSANLEPAKLRAEELAIQAGALASNSLQRKLDSDVMTVQLENLKSESRTLATLVRDVASDEEIATVLDTLNNTFHTIMENWKSETLNH